MQNYAQEFNVVVGVKVTIQNFKFYIQYFNILIVGVFYVKYHKRNKQGERLPIYFKGNLLLTI